MSGCGPRACYSRTVDLRELEGLPALVQRYFRVVLKEGQTMVTSVSVQHRDTFNMGQTTDQWKPYEPDQEVAVATQRPGFDWDVRVAIVPGLPVRVNDAYVTGEGILHASCSGSFRWSTCAAGAMYPGAN